jgi:hypothetical protein
MRARTGIHSFISSIHKKIINKIIYLPTFVSFLSAFDPFLSAFDQFYDSQINIKN